MCNDLGVVGVPTLLVMNKDGTVKNKNGRGDIVGGTGKPAEEVFNNWK